MSVSKNIPLENNTLGRIGSQSNKSGDGEGKHCHWIAGPSLAWKEYFFTVTCINDGPDHEVIELFTRLPRSAKHVARQHLEAASL